MTRQLAFLMRASKGGLTHAEILRLTWRQFQVYIDAFTWLLNEESEQGKKDNRKYDLQALAADPVAGEKAKARKKTLVEEARQKLDAFNKRWEGKKGQIVERKGP